MRRFAVRRRGRQTVQPPTIWAGWEEELSAASEEAEESVAAEEDSAEAEESAADDAEADAAAVVIAWAALLAPGITTLTSGCIRIQRMAQGARSAVCGFSRRPHLVVT